MSVALYRKYRSKSLDDIVGQDHVTDVLSRALAQGNIAHAYLLTGPRGTGKTSIARILAHEINKLPYTDDSEHLDIIEIDAASNNGVDDVRELRDKALIAPSSALKKIYIIDEVHMLSKPAFNALLKTLEEPPEHVVFILATTDFDKLPDTIVSRTQRYHFHTISAEEVVARLRYIASTESIAIDDEALAILARRGGGSMRDSVSLLDQVQHAVASGDTITATAVEQALGLATGDELGSLVTSLQSSNAQQVIAHVTAIESRGVSASTLAAQLVGRITEQLADTPALVHVLEGLMDVPKSSHPGTKLLVTLLGSIVDKPKTIALSAQPPASAVISRAVTPPKPRTTPVKTVAAPSTPVPEPPEDPGTVAVAPSAVLEADLSKFDWPTVVAYAREHYTAVYSILSKCSAEVDGDKIVLYAGRKFNKTKLDSAKYRPQLGEILAQTGVGAGAYVEILETTAPPKDAQAARIAAMMGGGEEVDVN